MYKPLPDGLTISISTIEGLGLFTESFVKKGTNFGVSHMKMNGMLIRTPLGGFINHSDTPNCTKNRYFMTNANDIKIKHDYTRYDLVALEDIKEGEELTVKYSFYNIE
jgi:SET domain-containing protein